jgi:phage shock protein PspC (stress-responsive transcriptional regulator)
MIAGVAGGLAEYFDLDVGIVRVGIVALTVLGGLGVPLYVAAWLLIPEEGYDETVADELAEHLRAHRVPSDVG